MSAPLSYTPYQSHRRAASTASFVSATSAPIDPTPQATQSAAAGTPPAKVTTQPATGFTRPVVGTEGAGPSSVPSTRLTSTRSGPAAGSSGAPPPLRSASSLKTVQPPPPASTSSPSRVLLSKGKGPAIGSSSASTAASVEVKSERRPSATLAVPGSSDHKLISQRKDDDSKPGSRVSSPAPSHHSHSRSLSSNAIPANLPHIMSTAQRLRTASPTGLNSSISSSPMHTSAGPSSPSLEPSTGRSVPLSDHGLLPESQTEMLGNGRRTAYRPGFQPRGTYRVRTDDFEAARARRRTNGGAGANGEQSEKSGTTRFELQSERLERRLEKLLAIHYDDSPLFTTEEAISLAPTWLPNAIRKARLQAEADRRVREEEMRIVKWEDDKNRKTCAVCSTTFSLTVRKHHCRLCGRVVCASPHLAMPPLGGIADVQASKEGLGGGASSDEAKCSSLMVSDRGESGAKIKEVPRWDETIGGTGVDQEGRTRGMRICRDCKETILHRQYMLDDGTTPTYLKLYDTLITLQKEIEQSLPEFQEMIMGLQKHDAAAALGTNVDDDVHDPLLPQTRDQHTLQAIKAKNRTALALQRDAAQARKQLLANFANYDLVAKKIRALDDEGNVSLARIKMAIYTRANVFLQTYMFPLQNLPKLNSSTSNSGRNSPPVRKGTPTKSGTSNHHHHKVVNSVNGTNDDQADIREQLSVLEQQLRQVRQYASSASKARKLQDASSLNASAKELEAEIERVKSRLR